MSTLQTTITTIEYDKKTKKEAFQLKELIEQSPLIFQMILSEYKGISFTEKEGYFNIVKEGNITKTLTTKIISILEKEYQKDSPQNTDSEIELAILKYALIERTDSFELYTIEKLPENMIYYYMAYLRYKKDNDEKSLIKFILHPTKEEKEVLFNCLHQKHGLTLYNVLLQEQLLLLLGKNKKLPPLDSFLVNNISDITTLIQDVFTKKLIESIQSKSINEPLEKISFEEYDRLCKEYLIKIDPSLKWLKIYLEAQEKERIKYLKDGEGKWLSCNKDGINIITAPLTGTIEDVVSTIHEFAHYVSLENIEAGENIPRTLAEFPSLFFEEHIYSFLLEKGYSESQIITLRNQRERWTEEHSMAVLPYLNYLKEFILEGPLTENKIKEYLKRVQLSIESSYETIEQGSMPERAASFLEGITPEMIFNECLIRNSFLIRKSDVLLEYPYVIGSYLTEQAILEAKIDQTVIYDMLGYTEELSKIAPQEIFARFNIPLSKTSETNKVYQNKKD